MRITRELVREATERFIEKGGEIIQLPPKPNPIKWDAAPKGEEPLPYRLEQEELKVVIQAFNSRRFL